MKLLVELCLFGGLFTSIYGSRGGNHGCSKCWNNDCVDDSYESEDNTPFGATLLESGTTSSSHSLCCYDIDWYEIELPYGCNCLTLETSSTYDDTDTILYLKTQSLNTIEYNDDIYYNFNGNWDDNNLLSKIDISCNDNDDEQLEQGTYYVAVVGYNWWKKKTYFDYSLYFEVFNCDVDTPVINETNNSTNMTNNNNETMVYNNTIEYETCDISELIMNWKEVIENGASDTIYYDIVVTINGIPDDNKSSTDYEYSMKDGIVIGVSVTADYIVQATYPDSTDFPFLGDNTIGATYILDTNVFSDRELPAANECENRFESSYNNVSDFNDYFEYTLQPSNPNNLGSNEYLSYPPSDWQLKWIKDNSSDRCNGYVEWYREFSLSELENCGGFEWSDEEDYLVFRGVFYLSLISPLPIIYPFASDYTYNTDWLSVQLLSHGVEIRVAKLINVLDNSNYDVEPSGSILIPVGFHEVYDGTNDYNNATADYSYFDLTVWTYVPNWMYLNPDGGDNELLSPTLDDLINQNPTIESGYWDQIVIQEATNPNGKNCYLEDSNRCWQKWKIQIRMTEDFGCQDNGKGIADDVDISGDYQLQFNYICDSPSSNECTTFENSLDSQTGTIVLEEDTLTFTETCDITVAQLDDMEGTLTFYEDSTFTTAINPDDTTYNPGDIVYLEISVDDLNNTLLGIELSSVILCTADETEVDSLGTPITSCEDFATLTDYHSYNVMADGENPGDALYPFIIYDTDNNTDHKIRFSFKMPSIANSRFYVEVGTQLTIDEDQAKKIASSSGNGGSVTVRRLLESTNSVNSYQTFFNGGSVNSGDTTPNENTTSDDNNDSTGLIIGLIVGFIVLLLIGLGVFLYIRHKKELTKGKENEELNTNINNSTGATATNVIQRQATTDTDAPAPITTDA